MNERGIFNIIGLCLLMVVAISITGIHETEGNFSHNAANVQISHDLKNAADSELLKAMEIVRKAQKVSMTVSRELARENPSDKFKTIGKGAVKKINSLNLERNKNTTIEDIQRKIHTATVDSGQLENIHVEVWAEIGDINEFVAYDYSAAKVKCYEYYPKKDGIVLMSIASWDGHYQSSMAYVLYDGNEYKYEINYINSTNLTLDENTVKKNHLQE